MQRTALGNREQEFMNWFREIAARLRLAPDPDDPLHHYDYRGAWASGLELPQKPGDHWPSIFKDENHPNRFISPKRDKRVPEGYIWDSKHNTLMREGHFASYYGNLAEDDDNGD